MLSRPSIFLAAVLMISILCLPEVALSWKNGPSGDAATDEDHPDCDVVPFSTHDWIPDHALALLPAEESAWLRPHKKLYLLGSEAPDNNNIPDACGAPHNGYDDRRAGHSVEWKSDMSGFAAHDNGDLKDRCARRAQEEYSKAIIAFQEEDLGAAAFFLGAMAHYIGDASQYGHAIPDEDHHSDYEGWVGTRTDQFDDDVFEDAIVLDSLVRRTPYTAVKRITKKTVSGSGDILAAATMDSIYSKKNEDSEDGEAYRTSVAASLNFGVNELADVLHTFFLNVVQE